MRWLAVIAAVLGALASLLFLVGVGHHAPLLLLALYAVWVLSPFAALLVARRVSQRWSSPTRAALRGLMLVVAVVSPIIYWRIAVDPPVSAAGLAFLVVPMASWLLIAIVLPLVARVSQRRAAA